MSTQLRTLGNPRPTRRKPTTMNGKSLLFQCHRPDLGTRYAYFCMGSDALKIIYLNIHSGLVQTAESESLPFAEYPDVRLLHDGNGWNVTELACWLKYAANPDREGTNA